MSNKIDLAPMWKEVCDAVDTAILSGAKAILQLLLDGNKDLLQREDLVKRFVELTGYTGNTDELADKLIESGFYFVLLMRRARAYNGVEAEGAIAVGTEQVCAAANAISRERLRFYVDLSTEVDGLRISDTIRRTCEIYYNARKRSDMEITKKETVKAGEIAACDFSKSVYSYSVVTVYCAACRRHVGLDFNNASSSTDIMAELVKAGWSFDKQATCPDCVKKNKASKVSLGNGITISSSDVVKPEKKEQDHCILCHATGKLICDDCVLIEAKRIEVERRANVNSPAKCALCGKHGQILCVECANKRGPENSPPRHI